VDFMDNTQSCEGIELAVRYLLKKHPVCLPEFERGWLAPMYKASF